MNMSHATGRQDVSFYNLLNNIEQRNTERGQFSVDYDDLNRLLDSRVTGAINDSEAFDYDGVGNRTTYQHNANPEQSWAYNDANQLQQISAGSTPLIDYVYDANGHQIKKTENGIDTHFVYNHEERLIRVEDHARNVIAAYNYNPFGHRLSKTVGGVTTYFLYNHQGMVGEYDASGALLKEYHYTPDSTWMTDPLFQRDGGQVYFYQNDHLGTPQRLLNQTGAIVWQADYRAFGQATVNTALVSNNLRFPGQYFDAETGLHHNYFRDYDPGLGRYVQGDPIGVSGGMNLYGYALQSPLKFFDNKGKAPSEPGGKIQSPLPEPIDPRKDTHPTKQEPQEPGKTKRKPGTGCKEILTICNQGCNQLAKRPCSPVQWLVVQAGCRGTCQVVYWLCVLEGAASEE